jgi:hypothetical protein
MECPICGETLPLSSKTCAACGNEYDGFFLTEEADSSAVRRSVTQQKPPRQPSALKPGRGPLSRTTLMWIGGGVAALVLIAIVAFIFIPRGKGGADKPAGAVSSYYQYLKSGDDAALLSLFVSGFQPTASEKIGLKAALAANSYSVTGPSVNVLTDDGKNATVAITSVDVAVTPKKGGTPQQYSLASLLSSAPGSTVVVRLENLGDGWKISGRTFGGWAPQNLWLVGDLKPPQ